MCFKIKKTSLLVDVHPSKMPLLKPPDELTQWTVRAAVTPEPLSYTCIYSCIIPSWQVPLIEGHDSWWNLQNKTSWESALHLPCRETVSEPWKCPKRLEHKFVSWTKSRTSLKSWTFFYYGENCLMASQSLFTTNAILKPYFIISVTVFNSCIE